MVILQVLYLVGYHHLIHLHKIIAKINLSRKTIKIAIFSFTSGEIASALEAAAKRGITIKLLADKIEAASKHSEIGYLSAAGIETKLLSGKKGRRGIMHHKFAVFDEKEIITGSYNWTDNAERFNYENAIFFNDPAVVQAFSKEFDKLWPLGTAVTR